MILTATLQQVTGNPPVLQEMNASESQQRSANKNFHVTKKYFVSDAE